MTNGTVLKKLRLKHNLSLRKMAVRIGVSETTIRAYEKADKLSIGRLKQYCVDLHEEEILIALNGLEELL